MLKVGGSYVKSIACDSLCQITSADSPSPTFASLRARRIVCVREVPMEARILPAVYEKFTDPFSELQGRNLHEHFVTFSPQYLAFFASNGPIPIAVDNAVRERTAIIDHVSVFKDSPVESNDMPWKDMQALLEDYRPGFFWILRAVFSHLLKGRQRRNVGPIPQASIKQKMVDCADACDDAFKSWLESIGPVRFPKDASTKEEIDGAAVKACGLAPAEVSIYLAGKGFLKTRRLRDQRNEYG